MHAYLSFKLSKLFFFVLPSAEHQKSTPEDTSGTFDMGKRKKSTRKPQGPKKKEPLPTNFPCLFCNHEKSVSVKLDKKAGVGELSCKVCGQQFQTGINYLSAGVDVYSDWIDACDAVAKETGDAASDDGLNSYEDLAAGNRRRNSEMNIDRHLVSAVGGNEYQGDDD